MVSVDVENTSRYSILCKCTSTSTPSTRCTLYSHGKSVNILKIRNRNSMIGTGEHKRQSLTNSAHRWPPDPEQSPIPSSPPRGTLVRYQGCCTFLITSTCVDIKDIPRLSGLLDFSLFCFFSGLFHAIRTVQSASAR